MNKVIIGIIGGTGNMGRWFEKFFSDSGHTVLISGRKTKLTYEDIVNKSNIVVLSMPLHASVNLAEKIGPLLGKDQALIDLCSLKEKILKVMLEHSSCEVFGTHPLFGPLTESIKGQNVVICPGRGEYWLKWLKKEFIKKEAVVTHMDAAAHDKNMALVQGLTHLLTICMGKTLQKMNIPPDEAVYCSTPVFKTKLDLVGRLFAQDLSLYKDLVGKNRYVKDVLEIFLASFDEAKKALLSEKDEDGIKFLENIRNFLGGYCEEGLKESGKILNSLYT